MAIRTRLLAVTAALFVSITGCTDSGVPIAPPLAPTPPPPAPSPGPSALTVSGRVIEFSATGEQRPVPNLRLRVRTSGVSDGALGGVELPDVITDANGRYEITGVTSLLLFISTGPGSDYRLLCDFYPLDLLLASRLPSLPWLRDLPVVHASWSGDQLPPGMWSPSTSVHGTVSERINGTRQPVADATVTLDSSNDPPATTTATGFYMICSVVGTDVYRTIAARKDGYVSATSQFFGGWDFRVDLELSRR